MPCVCKQKVDRIDPKIQCAKCKEIFHLHCVGFVQTDVDYLLSAGKSFLCEKCMAERRSSLRPPVSPVVSCERPLESSSLNTNNTNNINNAKPTVDNELDGLHAEDANMHSSLRFFRDDNKKLSRKFDALCAEFKLLSTNLQDRDAVITSLKSEIVDLRKAVVDLLKLVSDNALNVNKQKELSDNVNVPAACSLVMRDAVAAAADDVAGVPKSNTVDTSINSMTVLTNNSLTQSLLKGCR
ncbi:uncharacterized protein [Eurosta solidaginis]|uniref:uncharacterized protein n=1 Tax=Eurosta solidaginis TaxID=178769 RepID=UPI0035312C3F